MEYKELIAQLRRFAAYYPVTGPIEEKAADAIETLLAERDAAAVVHGRWKRNHQCQLYCSRCLEYQDPAIEKPYCSNCGAKMDMGVRSV